jgi:divalent metal cation (Fe/Co/Zn/Cd) transporter
VRRSKDPTVFAVLFEDSAALIGLVIALVGIALGEMLQMPVLDGVASLGIALVLAATAIFLGYESQSLLTGEAAYPEVRHGIEQIAAAAPGVHRINEVLTMHFGPEQVLAALSLDFDDAISAEAVERAVAEIERRIKAEFPEVTRIFVEAKDFEMHRRRLEHT